MATFTKTLLSGSTQGRGILVAATATAGTTIHVTGTSATTLDEIWLFATNNDTSTVQLTIEFGSVAVADNKVFALPSKAGETLVIPGLILRGNGTTGLTVAAFAGTTNKITLTGFVNRIA